MKRNCAIALLVLLTLSAAAEAASRVFDVRLRGAVGDGRTLDTDAFNASIDACEQAGGGQVLVPPGDYLCGTIRLKSDITLLIAPGARIIGTTDLEKYSGLSPSETGPENSRWHHALILGDGVRNVTITGGGTIDGNRVFDPRGEEHMRGPHAILFGSSRDIAIRDIHVTDAANYAILLLVTDSVDVRNVEVTGGWDGVHFRGRPDKPCRDVQITDCRFFTGDDSIAGEYWENTLIANCIINSSCNGIRLIGPARNLMVHDCLFFGPGRFEHRTSKRTNMLAGINLQPGGWGRTPGALDEVEISDVMMHDVSTPLHVVIKPGSTCGRLEVSRLTATGCYRAAASVESWAEAPIDSVALRDVQMDFTGGSDQKVQDPIRAPGADARALPAWGFYARNVRSLKLQDVRLDIDRPETRPVMILDTVTDLSMEDLHFPSTGGEPVRLLHVDHVRGVRNGDALK